MNFKIDDIIEHKTSKEHYKITDVFSTEFMQILTAEKEGTLFYFTNFDEIEVHNDANPVKLNCSHDWKSYAGLVEFYNYCTKCDKKDHGIRS